MRVRRVLKADGTRLPWYWTGNRLAENSKARSFSTMAESSIMEPARRNQRALPRAKATHRSAWSRLRWILAAVMAVAGAGGAFFWSRSGKGESGRERGGSGESQTSSKQAPTAQVIKPTRGGIERITDQPGTIRAFERATLYAKVSGYLKDLKVDRGDRVKRTRSWPRSMFPSLMSPCSRLSPACSIHERWPRKPRRG